MLPAWSRVTPQGWLNSPSPLPPLPHFARNLPSPVKTWRRLFPLSTTMRLPFFSHTRPAGRRSSPSPLPDFPHFRRNLPALSKTEMLLFHSSETYTRSRPSVATPNGQVDRPSPSPHWKNSASNSSSPGPPIFTSLTRIPKLFSLPRLATKAMPPFPRHIVCG